jgi:hypothetical protein
MKKSDYQALVYNAMGDSGYYHYNVRNESGTGDDLEEVAYNGGMMPADTTMVPRLLRTQPGDIMTTNCVIDAYNDLSKGDTLIIETDPTAATSAGAKKIGYLRKKTSGDTSYADQEWVVVKKYNMPDLQPGVKIQRVK